jgi:hypothetical protein
MLNLVTETPLHGSGKDIMTAFFNLCYEMRSTMTSVYAFSKTLMDRADRDMAEIDRLFSLYGGTDEDWESCRRASNSNSKPDTSRFSVVFTRKEN